MKLLHQDFEIRAADFNALVEVLQAAMDARGVPFAVQNRLLARFAPMHRDIINTR
jgi:hemoglobin